jgi:UDP-glucose:(heptosyl)LPS alpha-1,3-glucosyltransferase
MKIALVRRGWSASGGAEAYLRRLAAGLQDRGHVPVLIGSPEWPEDQWVNSDIRRVQAQSPQSFAGGARLAAAGCDLVFSMERIGACDIYRAGDGVHAAWQERRAVFEPSWKRWTRWMNQKNSQLLRLEKQTLGASGARLIIANSRMVRDEITSAFPGSEARIHVIPNGIPAVLPISLEREQRRRDLGVLPEETVFLFAGSGWERKGLRFAAEAVHGIPGARLIVAGRGRLRGGVPPEVQLLGPVKQMETIYAAADVFVLPTIYDPFSNACLEALAHGLPVITTVANGCSEILTPDVHGTVVPVGDIRNLREAMIFWTDAGKRAVARSACRELAGTYSMDENIRRTLEVIDLVVTR